MAVEPADGERTSEADPAEAIEPPTSAARTSSGFLARLPSLVAAESPCLHVGVDENGMGPLLGPLVVTAVAFRIRGPRPARGGLGALVGDSKALVSHGDVSLGEAWARALLASIGPEPRSPAELLARISIDDEATLRAPCPSSAAEGASPLGEVGAMCWGAHAEPFHAEPALVERCKATLRGWSGEKAKGRFARRTPLEFQAIRASIVCVSRLNELHARGRHKFVVDLHEMERLALALHGEQVERHGRDSVGPLDAVCGKVGGMGYYGDYFGPLSSRLCAIEAEGARASAYRFPGLGRFVFLQDADDTDPLVGLASIVGKYLRELVMGRIVGWMRAAATPENCAETELPNASGYRDPASKRFIAATELIRAHRGVPDRCFLRRA